MISLNFIYFRYTGENEEEDVINQETLHLQRLKQKIEERKKAYKLNKKIPEIITLKDPKPIKNLDNELISKDDNKQSSLNNQNDELDSLDARTESNKKDKLSKSKSEFKILGTTEFEKKSKVFNNSYYFIST